MADKVLQNKDKILFFTINNAGDSIDRTDFQTDSNQLFIDRVSAVVPDNVAGEIKMTINDVEICCEKYDIVRMKVSPDMIPDSFAGIKLQSPIRGQGSNVKINYKDKSMPGAVYPHEIKVYLHGAFEISI